MHGFNNNQIFKGINPPPATFQSNLQNTSNITQKSNQIPPTNVSRSSGYKSTGNDQKQPSKAQQLPQSLLKSTDKSTPCATLQKITESHGFFGSSSQSSQQYPTSSSKQSFSPNPHYLHTETSINNHIPNNTNASYDIACSAYNARMTKGMIMTTTTITTPKGNHKQQQQLQQQQQYSAHSPSSPKPSSLALKNSNSNAFFKEGQESTNNNNNHHNNYYVASYLPVNNQRTQNQQSQQSLNPQRSSNSTLNKTVNCILSGKCCDDMSLPSSSNPTLYENPNLTLPSDQVYQQQQQQLQQLYLKQQSMALETQQQQQISQQPVIQNNIKSTMKPDPLSPKSLGLKPITLNNNNVYSQDSKLQQQQPTKLSSSRGSRSNLLIANDKSKPYSFYSGVSLQQQAPCMSPTGIGMRQTHFEAKKEGNNSNNNNIHSPISSRTSGIVMQTNSNNTNNTRNKVSKGMKEGIAKQVGMIVNNPSSSSSSTGFLGKINSIDSISKGSGGFKTTLNASRLLSGAVGNPTNQLANQGNQEFHEQVMIHNNNSMYHNGVKSQEQSQLSQSHSKNLIISIEQENQTQMSPAFGESTPKELIEQQSIRESPVPLGLGIHQQLETPIRQIKNKNNENPLSIGVVSEPIRQTTPSPNSRIIKSGNIQQQSQQEQQQQQLLQMKTMNTPSVATLNGCYSSSSSSKRYITSCRNISPKDGNNSNSNSINSSLNIKPQAISLSPNSHKNKNTFNHNINASLNTSTQQSQQQQQQQQQQQSQGNNTHNLHQHLFSKKLHLQQQQQQLQQNQDIKNIQTTPLQGHQQQQSQQSSSSSPINNSYPTNSSTYPAAKISTPVITTASTTQATQSNSINTNNKNPSNYNDSLKSNTTFGKKTITTTLNTNHSAEILQPHYNRNSQAHNEQLTRLATNNPSLSPQNTSKILKAQQIVSNQPKPIVALESLTQRNLINSSSSSAIIAKQQQQVSKQGISPLTLDKKDNNNNTKIPDAITGSQPIDLIPKQPSQQACTSTIPDSSRISPKYGISPMLFHRSSSPPYQDPTSENTSMSSKSPKSTQQQLTIYSQQQQPSSNPKLNKLSQTQSMQQLISNTNNNVNPSLKSNYLGQGVSQQSVQLLKTQQQSHQTQSTQSPLNLSQNIVLHQANRISSSDTQQPQQQASTISDQQSSSKILITSSSQYASQQQSQSIPSSQYQSQDKSEKINSSVQQTQSNMSSNWQSQKASNSNLLFMAKTDNYQECLRLLAKNKHQNTPQTHLIDINSKEQDTNNTALHFAAMNGNISLVSLLLYNSANIDSLNSNLRTPLMLAGQYGHLDVIQELIQAGADINQLDNNSNTILHIAAENGQDKVVQLLLERPSLMIFLKNKAGKDPVSLSSTVKVKEAFEAFFIKAKSIPVNKLIIQDVEPKEVQEMIEGGRSKGQVEEMIQVSPVFDKEIRGSCSNRSKINGQQGVCNIRKNVEYEGKNNNNNSCNNNTNSLNDKNCSTSDDSQKSSLNQQQQQQKIQDLGENGEKDEIEVEKVGPKDFLVHGLIGKGSFGEVYLVEKKQNSMLYAMKVLHKSKIIRHNLTKYAMTERNVMSLTDHPFVVRLDYAFQTKDKLFLIMDYCPGGDLGEHLQKDKKFSEELVRIYLAETILALEDLHKRDVIFRDLKPDNIVLDYEGHVKLTDFGLSKEGVLDHATGARSFCGSVAYLAPEMLKRCGHGKAVDWYLLGVVMYELLVGIPPYYATNRDELFSNIEKASLKIPSFLSIEARSLLKALLQRNPLKRLGSGKGDADEIKAHPFFCNINWQNVLERKLKPPKPNRKIRICTKIDPDLFAEEDYQGETDYIPGWSFVQP